MWSNRIIVGAGVALVVVAAVDAVRSSDHNTNTSPASTTTANAKGGTLPPRCARRDISVRIEIRRPSSLQTVGGEFEAPGEATVATIVVRNVGSRRCLGAWPFVFTVTDRTGKQIGQWIDGQWFAERWRPNSEKTFSLPGVHRCDRPGPFVAVANVGPYVAHRGNLTLSEITC
jgi:hypothetical protein